VAVAPAPPACAAAGAQTAAAASVALSRAAPLLGDGLAPFLLLPAASPLNAERVAMVVASYGACRALAALNGSAAQCGNVSLVVGGGVYFILGRGGALGMVAEGPCGQ
jgi:hypothetical protein